MTPVQSAFPDIDLIIFDCDGTLVDSEYLNHIATAHLLGEMGLDYDIRDIVAQFKGMKLSKVIPHLEARHGVRFPGDYSSEYVRLVEENAPKHLKVVEGISDFVNSAAKKYKICIGSNGEITNITSSIERCDLKKFFPDSAIFNAAMVSQPKPAPDLFLFAAEKMGVSPERCLVIEDTALGTEAAVLAGMNIWGFTGTADDPEKSAQEMRQSGAQRIIAHFREIQNEIDGDFPQRSQQSA